MEAVGDYLGANTRTADCLRLLGTGGLHNRNHCNTCERGIASNSYSLSVFTKMCDSESSKDDALCAGLPFRSHEMAQDKQVEKNWIDGWTLCAVLSTVEPQLFPFILPLPAALPTLQPISSILAAAERRRKPRLQRLVARG